MPLVIKAYILSLLFFLISSSNVSAQVVINEYLPHPSSGPDWIELYSPIDSDISEYILRDTTSDMKRLLSGVIIGPSTSTNCYVDVGNRLNNGGDTILLLQVDGSLPAVDEHSYSSDPGVDVSWCRSPDGGAWDTCTSAPKTLIECDSLVPTPTPTPTNTPTPTKAPTPTKTPTPTKNSTPTKTPTPKPTVKAAATKAPTNITGSTKDEEERENLTLGLRGELSVTPTSGESEELGSGGKFPWLAGVFILAGVGFIGAAVYPFLKKRYNLGSVTKKKDN